ncbi:MAG: phosphotransferase family protein [Pseudomonadales bacterium]|nr:phosphotransferase family protein [Pseudomonadales bacterium]MDP6473250.1 phosphotransferase family protein [Pseudomonadales bacterium]MDP6829175.1 phosphotransferase family protein [Pseudomonadales bacterium]
MINAEQHAALADYLADALRTQGPVEIRGEGRIAMGQSRAMYVLDLAYPGSSGPVERQVVVRVEQWGLLGTNSRDEVRIMQALHGADFPVARILAYEPSCDVLDQPFFVMEFVAGKSAFDPETVDDYVLALDRLHGLDTGDFDFLDQPQEKRDSALLQVERWYGLYRSCLVEEPSPFVEEATQWLRNHAPVSQRVALVHGDPGPGNYMHADGRISALVDWEFTHLGDPDEDWAYLIAMRGAPYFSQAEWLTRIERLTGHEITPERLRYWKGLNFLKGVAVDQTAHRIYVDRVVAAPNLLAIGTGVHLNALKRLCETVL